VLARALLLAALLAAWSFAYPASPRVALLKPTLGVQVVAVDGDRSMGMKAAQAPGDPDYELTLPAGEHRIEIVSGQRRILHFEAKPGRKYLITDTRIEDVTNNLERYCAMASAVDFQGC
jgi:hypothetical protein